MAQLDVLSDDCLIEVLDRLPPKDLFRMIGVNRRMKRLATIKLQVKIMAIKLSSTENHKSDRVESDCAHPDSFNQDQVLVLWPTIRRNPLNASLYKPRMRATLLSILTKCAGVKSVDFDNFELPCDLLPEMFRRCLELECIKFLPGDVELEEWSRALDQIGRRIIHLAKCSCYKTPSDSQLLASVAAKCPNIKRVDWVMMDRLTRDFLEALKMLPKNCWIKLKTFDQEVRPHSSVFLQLLFNNNFPDVVDELDVCALQWSALDDRYDRLSILKFFTLDASGGGVEFAGLKKLDASGFSLYNHEAVDCLVASSFPQLEEFCFKSQRYDEHDYDALFQRMVSVRKLTIEVNQPLHHDDVLQLPQTAIRRLKKLETINFQLSYVSTNWQPKDFLQQVEKYVDEIRSLKKVTIGKKRHDNYKHNWKNTMVNEVKRINLKQNRVKVLILKSLFIGF